MNGFGALITVGSTLMVVGAALLAAAPVYKNLSLSKEHNVPKIEFSIYGASFGGTEPGFDKSFDGVKIVNTGHTEIVLDAITMDVALPEESKTLRELWGVEPAYEYNGSPLNVNRESLPHRLMPGDSFARLYDRDRIMQATQGRRIRPMCQGHARQRVQAPVLAVLRRQSRNDRQQRPGAGDERADDVNRSAGKEGATWLSSGSSGGFWEVPGATSRLRWRVNLSPAGRRQSWRGQRLR